MILLQEHEELSGTVGSLPSANLCVLRGDRFPREKLNRGGRRGSRRRFHDTVLTSRTLRFARSSMIEGIQGDG